MDSFRLGTVDAAPVFSPSYDMPTSVIRSAFTRDGVTTPLGRSIAIDYMETFDLDEVAKKYNTTAKVIRHVVDNPAMVDYMNRRMGDIEPLLRVAQRRLIEATMKEALSETAGRSRTAARKLMMDRVFPALNVHKHEHHFYLETPPQSETVEDWEAQYAGKMIAAEVVEEDPNE